MKVYLAGAINGKTIEEANGWRDQVAKILALYDIEVLNPLRGKEEDRFYDYDVNEIVHRDLDDIKRADIVLVEYMDKHRPYTGTDMEIVYARLWNKPVIVVTDWCKSYWLKYHATKIVSTFVAAADYIINWYREGRV